MRVHTGVGHTDSESAHILETRKNSHNCVLVLLTQAGFEPLVFALNLESDAQPTEPPQEEVEEQEIEKEKEEDQRRRKGKRRRRKKDSSCSSDKLATTHNVWLHIREDLGPSL